MAQNDEIKKDKYFIEYARYSFEEDTPKGTKLGKIEGKGFTEIEWKKYKKDNPLTKNIQIFKYPWPKEV